MKLKIVGFLIAAQFLLLPTTFADEAWLGGTGSNASSPNGQSPDIQMVNETINLEIHPPISYEPFDSTMPKAGGYTNVDVQYLFKNHSNTAVTVKMGFPETCRESFNCSHESDPDLQPNSTILNEFKAFLNGQEIAVTFEEGTRDPETYTTTNWYTSSVTFAPNEEKTIRNTYWITHSHYKYDSWTNYTLETGATWKGVIEEVNVIAKLIPPAGGVEFSPYNLVTVTPDGFTYDFANNSIRWKLKNLEPTSDHNIQINYLRPNESPFPCSMSPDESIDMASSILPADSESLIYYPCLSNDYSIHTAWVEGVDGPGIGEWLRTPLQLDKTYDNFWFGNGYMSSQDIWAKNNRVKKAKLTFEGYAEFEQIVTFEDVYGTQEINLNQPITGSEYAQLEILEVYPGSEFDDTAISEIQFRGLLNNRADGSSSFSDISGHKYEDQINYIRELGIVQGYEDGTYRPDALINRAEFTKIIIESFFPGSAKGSNCFPDVKEEWFAKYICYAKSQSFIEGYTDGTFKPANNISLVEAFKIILTSFVAELGELMPVPEEGQAWYTVYVEMMNNITGETVSPATYDSLITRGQMADLIYKVLVNPQGKPVFYLLGISKSDNLYEVEVESATFYSGQRAVNVAVMETGCTREKVSGCAGSLNNNFYISKSGDRKTLILDADATITMELNTYPTVPDLSVNEFFAQWGDDISSLNPFYLTLNEAGQVSNLTQIYLP